MLTIEPRLINRIKDIPDVRTCLPPPFEEMLQDDLRRLPYATVRPDADDFGLFGVYTESLKPLERLCEEMNAAYASMLAAMIQVSTDDPKLYHGVRRSKAEELSKLLPRITFTPPDVANYENFEQPTPVIRDLFGRTLLTVGRDLFTQFHRGFQLLTDRRIVGLHRESTKKPGLTVYEYYRFLATIAAFNRRTETKVRERVGERKIEGTVRTAVRQWEEQVEVIRRTVTSVDMERVDVSRRIRHELLNSRKTLWNDTTVKQPACVAWLFQQLPPWLRDRLRVVSGNMTREQYVDVDTRVEKWTERSEEEVTLSTTIRRGVQYSPAVVLGPFVLAGWSGRDL